MSLPLSAGDIAYAILALIKTTWRLGSSLSRLDQEPNSVDDTVKNLVWEVKSLGNECDLIYSELEDNAIGKHDSSIIDGRIWTSLTTQIEATGHTLQQLDLFVQSIKRDTSAFVSQRQRSLDNSKEQISDFRTKISKHADYLRLASLLIKT